MTIAVHDCPACGAPVALEVGDPDDPAGAMAAKLARIQRCSGCIDKELLAERARQQARSEHHFLIEVQKSGLPVGLQGSEWEHMRHEMGRLEVIDATKAWVQEGGGFFLHSERPGPGKTKLAATACWALLRKGAQPKFVQAAVLLTKANSDFHSEGRKHAEALLFGRGPLFLDDLGKESPTPLSRQLLQTALDERIANKQHVFVTSNFTAAQLGAVHGDWLASRLARFQQWRMPGPDMRLETELT